MVRGLEETHWVEHWAVEIIRYENEESYDILTEEHLKVEFFYEVKFNLMLKEFVRQTKGTKVKYFSVKIIVQKWKHFLAENISEVFHSDWL